MKYDRTEIGLALGAAHRLVNSGRCSGEDVLNILGKYHDCTGVIGISEHFQNQSIGLIHALTADGFRVGKQFAIAAEWYSKTSQYWSGHAPIYARMVVEHHLAEHYARALATIESWDREWRQRTIPNRTFYVLGKWTAIFDAEWLSIMWHRNSDRKFLEKNVIRPA